MKILVEQVGVTVSSPIGVFSSMKKAINGMETYQASTVRANGNCDTAAYEMREIKTDNLIPWAGSKRQNTGNLLARYIVSNKTVLQKSE